MRNGKHLIIGALCGIASTLIGVSLAKAACDSATFAEAERVCTTEECWDEFLTVAESACEWDRALSAARESCDEAAQSWIEDEGLTEEVIGGQGGMWEACMRLSVPVGPLPASVHYDTTDGAFWRVSK